MQRSLPGLPTRAFLEPVHVRVACSENTQRTLLRDATLIPVDHGVHSVLGIVLLWEKAIVATVLGVWALRRVIVGMAC